MCWKVIQGRPRHSFSINVTQNIFKSAPLRAAVGVPSGGFSNNGQKGFPLLYDGEPEPWPPAIHSARAAVKRKELAPGAEMWGHTLRCEGAHVTLIFKVVWCSCWRDRIIWSCGVFYPLEARPGSWLEQRRWLQRQKTKQNIDVHCSYTIDHSSLFQRKFQYSNTKKTVIKPNLAKISFEICGETLEMTCST